jgi:hypothetical protein
MRSNEELGALAEALSQIVWHKQDLYALLLRCGVPAGFWRHLQVRPDLSKKRIARHVISSLALHGQESVMARLVGTVIRWAHFDESGVNEMRARRAVARLRNLGGLPGNSGPLLPGRRRTAT